MFADGSCCQLRYVVMHRDNGLFTILNVLEHRMATFLSSCWQAVVFAQKAKEFLFLHAFTAIRRLKYLRPAYWRRTLSCRSSNTSSMASRMFSSNSCSVAPCEMASGTCSHCPQNKPVSASFSMIMLYSDMPYTLYFRLQRYTLNLTWTNYFSSVRKIL